MKQLKPSPAEDALLVFAQCSVFMSLMVICGLCLTSDGMRELVNQGKFDHTCPKVIIKMEEEARVLRAEVARLEEDLRRIRAVVVEAADVPVGTALPIPSDVPDGDEVDGLGAAALPAAAPM